MRRETDVGFWETPVVRRVLSAGGVALAFGWLLLASYPAQALVFLVVFFFVVYLGLRVLNWMEGNRFSPARLRVGLTWALMGVDAETDEYDVRPATVYFCLLGMLAIGLLLRPVAQWMVG